MKCPLCGKPVEDGAAFCPYCGMKLDPERARRRRKAPPVQCRRKSVRRAHRRPKRPSQRRSLNGKARLRSPLRRRRVAPQKTRPPARRRAARALPPGAQPRRREECRLTASRRARRIMASRSPAQPTGPMPLRRV